MRTDDVCPLCGSNDTDLGRHAVLDEAWWHCYICGYEWKRSPNPDNSLIALRYIEGTEVPLEERYHISPSALQGIKGEVEK